MSRKVRWLAGVGLVLGGCFPTATWGQTLSWNNPAGGSFHLGSNWTPSGPPGVTQSALFNLSSSYFVTFTSNVENRGLTVSRGAVAFNIGAGNTYTLSQLQATQVGNTFGQAATLYVQNGTLHILDGQGSNTGGIATAVNSSGTLRVEGATAHLITNSFFDIGVFGNGRLEVYAGATANIGNSSYVGSESASTGYVEVSGNNATLTMGGNTRIGYSGSGEVKVMQTGQAFFGTSLTLGTNSGSTGKLTIGEDAGNTGTVTTQGITIGANGTGQLSIMNQSSLTNYGNVFLATNAGSTGTATLTAGTWNQSGGSIYLGGNAFSDGGIGSIQLGLNSTLNITGAGNGIVVRNQGTLTLGPDSTVNTVNLSRMNNGVIDMQGGSLNIADGNFNNGGSYFNINGRLAFSNATLTNTTDLSVGQSSALSVSNGSILQIAGLYIGRLATNSQADITSSQVYIGSNLFVGSLGGSGRFNINPGSAVIESGTGTYIGVDSSTGQLLLKPSAYLQTTQTVFGAYGGVGSAQVQGLWYNSGDFELGGSTFNGNYFPGQSAALTIDSGGSLQVYGNLNLYSAGTLNLNGGTVSMLNLLTSGGLFHFNQGTVQFIGNWNADYYQLQALLGTTPVLRQDQAIQVAGNTNLTSTLILNGGTFRTDTITNLNKLSIQSGRFEINNGSAVIGTLQDNSFGTQLTLGSGSTVRISNNLDILGPLYLSGGSISAGVINNQNEVIFTQITSSFGRIGDALNNSGRIRGSGRVQADLNNGANGRILVENGQTLLFSGNNNQNNTNGTIELSGGTIEFTNSLNNNAGGFISGRGTFRGSSANTSGIGLNNEGTVAFSAGVSDVFGKVTNTATGRIITAGAGTVTFHDDVVHNGIEIRTGGGSRTVFLGAVSGDGPFTGTGTVEYQGDLRPGNSPANIMYAGSVEIGASATTHFEIGGLLAGSQYDRLTIAGSIALDGRLDIALIQGFHPEAGQQFTLIDNLGSGDIQGHYLNLLEGTQFNSGGQAWAISYHGGDGNNLVLTAVPEPATWALIGLSATTTGFYLRKRYRDRQLELDNELTIRVE